MTLRVRIRPEAQREIVSSARWYESREPELGVEFWDSLDRVVEAIREDPERFPTVYKEFRRALLRRFPYSVFFRTRQGEIVVAAVLHQKRNPAAVRRRLH